jgi:4-alpha-glucanotransferase
MGLHRLFWIPRGGEPKDGVYVRYPEEELYAILLIESRRHRCAIVGEDLGTVPEYVPKMMARHGLRRMYVVQYELKPEEVPEPAVRSVAGVNTHDMPTFAAFWEGKDIDDRVARGLLDGKGAREEHEKRGRMRETLLRALTARGLLEGDVLKAVLEYLAGTPAEMVLVNLEDLWGETRPQNVPGVPEESWRNRFRYTLEEMKERPEVVETLRRVDRRRRASDARQT